MIKRLERKSPGNFIVNNTMWKDLEVYALAHPKLADNPEDFFRLLVEIESDNSRTKYFASKELTKLKNRHSQNYASLAVDIER